MKLVLVFVSALLLTTCASAPPKKEISYMSGSTKLQGYLSYDYKSTKKRPGIIVVHEWWGHNDYARKRADMLAKLGYTALALDMYGDGKQANHPKDAGAFSGAVMKDEKVMNERFNAALEILKNHPSVDPTKIAAIGYCFGGGVVLEMARRGSDLKGVVSFHGFVGHIKKTPKGQVKAKMLVLNGEADPMTTKKDIKSFKKNMTEAGVSYQFINYKDAKHAFTNPAATEFGKKFNIPISYQKKADEESWAEMQKFFQDIF
ncbi:MAG: dienelactone hydrolase family protein [Spirochaetota bacterium]